MHACTAGIQTLVTPEVAALPVLVYLPACRHQMASNSYATDQEGQELVAAVLVVRSPNAADRVRRLCGACSAAANRPVHRTMVCPEKAASVTGYIPPCDPADPSSTLSSSCKTSSSRGRFATNKRTANFPTNEDTNQREDAANLELQKLQPASFMCNCTQRAILSIVR